MLENFLKWRSQCSDPVPQCSPDNQARAIDIIESCHFIMVNKLVDAFNLKNADREKLITMINKLKNDFRIIDVIILIILIA